MDDKLNLTDEQETKIRELYADFNKQKYSREKRREAMELSLIHICFLRIYVFVLKLKGGLT